MLDGKRFLPLTGIPMRNKARMIAMLAVWLPEPLTVATTIEKSLVIGAATGSLGPASEGAGRWRFIPRPLSSCRHAPGCASASRSRQPEAAVCGADRGDRSALACRLGGPPGAGVAPPPGG